MKPTDLSDTRCLNCATGPLRFNSDQSKLVCPNCAAEYDTYEGIPCLARYQNDEILSLIEILSVIGDKRVPPSPQSYKAWGQSLIEYHNAADRDAYLETRQGGIKRYLAHRHRQFEVMEALLEGEALEGVKILDIGAGEGFDTALLQARGAHVTALEFSPRSSAVGAPATPDARWFVGSGHALPFTDESFDVVACQATLHHMLDIPQCIREALRVLKPGGLFVSISDSYRADRHGEDYVCRRFNDDMAVLSGVNENIPAFTEFFETIDAYKDDLDVSFYTSRVFGYPDPELKKRVDIPTPKWWGIEDAEYLSDSGGGISCKIRKKTRLSIEPAILTNEAVRASEVMAHSKDKDASMASLARRIQKTYAQTPFPGEAGNTKFQLLNGWRAREEDENGRTAYNRARWYFIRQQNEKRLVVETSAIENGADALICLIDGVAMPELMLTQTPTTVEYDLSKTPVDAPFCVELRSPEKATSLEAGLFRVNAMTLIPDLHNELGVLPKIRAMLSSLKTKLGT